MHVAGRKDRKKVLGYAVLPAAHIHNCLPDEAMTTLHHLSTGQVGHEGLGISGYLAQLHRSTFQKKLAKSYILSQ